LIVIAKMDEENLGIKQVEKILAREISDWLRWGRNKDYLPVSFRCPLGYLYKPMRGDLEANLRRQPPINLLEVVEFERLVIGLPDKHRQAFVMYHLGRAEINGRVEERKRTGYEIARLLGVHRSRYYVLLTQAHNMIFRTWKQHQD
jgi:hypothetical protein